MGTAIRNHFQAQNRQKRKADVVSLDYAAEDCIFADMIEDRRADVESVVCAAEFLDNFDGDAKKMLKMRAFGNNNGEIARRFKKPVNVVANEINSLYQSAMELMAA